MNQFKILTPTDFPVAAHFIRNLNQHKSKRIGYCGVEYHDILKGLQRDFFVDNHSSICVAEKDGKITALIGLDIDEGIAEVWGPFSIHNHTSVQLQLWNFVKVSFPSIQQFLFFIHEENLEQQQFMETIQANNDGTHLYMAAHRTQAIMAEHYQSRPFLKDDFLVFQALHDKIFLNAYYDANAICNLIQTSPEEYKLIILCSENIMQGYAFYSINYEINSAHLEFIAIEPIHRGNGYGKILLTEVLGQVFLNPSIEDVTLTVSHSNVQANLLYEQVGFHKQDRLISYSIVY